MIKIENLNIELKKRRLFLGLTLEDVGELVGVTKSTVRKWETGDIENMKRDKIILLAKALKVSPMYIMGLDDNYSQESSNIHDIKEKQLLKYFNKLNDLGKEKAIDNIQDLTQIDKYTINNNKEDEKQDKIKKFNLKEELEKLDPIETVAAHNDHWDEPGEMEKMLEDLDNMDKLDW
ncbi:helix-turn-helix domain-containing protein [Metaclostridioides mangenotii]|uniref:helix-turn-helix domain-containing protein n=1 Tax=Metaclostridioides mangenotii TaxID=1540 RepID=UPI0026EA66F6|nr:helix-turn-helix domain-containing protein [Clostridioides mangenotii]